VCVQTVSLDRSIQGELMDLQTAKADLALNPSNGKRLEALIVAAIEHNESLLTVGVLLIARAIASIEKTAEITEQRLSR
jgi:hypothetical protein